MREQPLPNRTCITRTNWSIASRTTTSLRFPISDDDHHTDRNLDEHLVELEIMELGILVIANPDVGLALATALYEACAEQAQDTATTHPHCPKCETINPELMNRCTIPGCPGKGVFLAHIGRQRRK